MKNKDLYDKLFEGLEDHEIITICLAHSSTIGHANDHDNDLYFNDTINVTLYLIYKFVGKNNDCDLTNPPPVTLKFAKDAYIAGYKDK